MSLSAVLDANGITAPSYADVLAGLQTVFQTIYGSDAYLAPDSQDGQFLAQIAAVLDDNNKMAVALYQAFAPTFAQGAGLSAGVKINGLRRLIATKSTVPATLVGQAGTIISNGVAVDTAGQKWDLPATVVIPLSGTIIVTATAEVEGALTCPIAALTGIATPTRGWQSVTNATAATVGAPVESDAALRLRQSMSTAIPSQAIVEGILAAIENVTGVQRARVYENATGTTDVNGIPAHSISPVVDGGDVLEVAEAIYTRKPPGIQTYGSTSQLVTDTIGMPMQINFYPLTKVTLTLTVTIKLLPGYISSTGDALKAALAEFINDLDIGEYSYNARLYGPATLMGDAATDSSGLSQQALDQLSKTFNLLSITQSRASNPADTTVTGGPYTAGAVAASVANTADIYAGQTIAFRLDNAALHQVVVSGVAGSSVSFSPAVPVGRNIPTSANVYLISDAKITFNEAAQALVTDITLVTA